MSLPEIKTGTAVVLVSEVLSRLKAAIDCLDERPTDLPLAAVLLSDCQEIAQRSLPYDCPAPTGRVTGVSPASAALLLRQHVAQLQNFYDLAFADGGAVETTESPVRLLVGTMITVSSLLHSPTFQEAKAYWTAAKPERN